MKYVHLVVYLALATSAYGQTVIKGTVKDSQGHPIPGANIILADSYDGSSSDAQGRFSFTTSETGEGRVIVRFVGYKTAERRISISGADIQVDFVLAEEVNQLEAVTITAGSFTASDETRRTVFRAVDIATTAGATADIAGALNTLPGTQKVGETGRLFVRGGDGNETRTFIDGMLVLDAYGPAAPNTPSRGRFLPFMFKGTSFSTGGYSAEYGQALSSALALDSKDEAEITRTDIGLLSVGGDVAHTRSWEGGSAAGKIQYTNLRPYTNLINQEIDWNEAPASWEGVTALRQKVGKNGMAKLYGNFNVSSFSLYNHSIDDPSLRTLYELENKYGYVNGSYKTTLGKNWAVRGGLAYSSIRNNVAVGSVRVPESEQGLHIKTVFEGAISHAVEIKTGAEVITRTYMQKYLAESAGEFLFDFDEVISAVFSEADIYISNKFVSRIGLRGEHNTLLESTALDPRASLAYKAGKDGQVSLAWGTFRQTPANQHIRVHDDLQSEKAVHYILNYQRIRNNRTFRIETYYKRYSDLVRFTTTGGATNEGYGYAKGVELFWRDNRSVRNLDYWVSYSLLDTKRRYLHFPNSAMPHFASRHNYSVVTKYFVRSLKSQLGATYSFASGRPYNNPNQDRFNASLTPTYQDLSFNWSYLPKPQLIVFFSCTNLLGRDNIFGYEYGTQRDGNGMYNGRAIRQPAPRFVFLGIFLTLSKEKGLNQLPSL